MTMGDNFKRSEYALDLSFMNDFMFLEESYKRRTTIKNIDLENKLNNRQSANFIELLTFGIDVYKYMKDCLQDTNINIKYSYNVKVNNLLNQIKSIYEKVLLKFQHEQEIYKQYYKFCQWTGLKVSSRVCLLIYKNHENNDDLYCLAAKWYYLDRKDYNYSIGLLEQRWEKQKDKYIIFNQLVQYEIVNNNINGKPEFLERMKRRFDDMISHIDEFQEYSKLINWMESTNNTTELQKMLIALIKQKFSKNYLMWDLLAMRENKGFHEGDETNLTLPKKNNLVIRKYEEGMLNLDTTNKSCLWELFLSFLQRVAKEEPIENETLFLVLNAYEKSDKLGYISEDGFVSYVDLSRKKNKLTILNFGINKYPQSVLLWKQKFQFILTNRPAQVKETFESAVSKLKEKSGEIWVMMLRYHIINSSFREICEFFENVATQPEEVTYHLRHKYIIWLMQNKSIEDCRKAYKKFEVQKPPSMELYKTMATIEQSQINKSLEDLMYVYNSGCKLFGTQYIEVWLEYQKFILYIYNGSDADREAKLMEISDSAREKLPSSLFVEFKLVYEKIRDRHSAMFGKIRNKV